MLKNKWIKYFTREHSLFDVLVLNEGYTKGMRKRIGWGFSNILFISRNGLETSYRAKKDEEKLRNFIKKRIINDKDFIFRICNIVLDYSRQGIEIAKNIQKTNLEKLAKNNLLNIFNNFYSIYRKFWSVYVFPMYVEKLLPQKSLQLYKKTLVETKKGSEFAYPVMEKAWQKLFGDIAKRAGADKKLIPYASPKEIKKFLIFNKSFDKLKLIKRYEYYVLLTKNRKTNLYIGEIAKKIEHKEIGIDKIEKEIKEINGQTASEGKVVKGKVKIILHKSNFVKMRVGDILVAPMTRPDYFSVIKKAAAIVTDEGGLTCHAAIVSRELGIPCIIGTKIATRVLKDGQRVEVDANRGVVKIIKQH